MLESLQVAAARVLVDGGAASPKIVGFVAAMEKAIANGHSLIPCPHCFLSGSAGGLLLQQAAKEDRPALVCEDCLLGIDLPAEA